jgi:MoaA/NifB/PqqE/SkfB family radical SAM enzyme
MIKTLSLVYTKHCNAFCRMCSANAGPARKEKMSLSQVRMYLGQAREVSGLKTVVLTGGEPLIFFDEVVEIIAEAYSAGFVAKIVTNGFWAESEEAARARLRILKDNGLNGIALSTDSYHQEYVPMKNIQYVLQAAKELKISSEVGMIVGKRDQQSVRDQLESIGLNEEFVLISNFINLEIPSYRKELGEKTALAFMPLQLFGRGNNLQEDAILQTADEFDVTFCPMVGRVVRVLPDGEIYWCCCEEEQDGKGKGYFRMGNLNTISLRELDKRLACDPLCGYLAYQGPVNLLMDVKNLPGLLKPKERFTCMCDVCIEAFRIADKKTLYSVARRQTILTEMLEKIMSNIRAGE